MSDQKTAVDVLRDARALIEKGWTQGDYAKTMDGKGVMCESPLAVCWCPLGAIFSQQCWAETADRAEDALRRAVRAHCIPHWNDSPRRTKAQVLAGFDKAIDLAQAEQTA